jgi:hypothetical protein
MTGWNLPPGVSVRDLPGNEPTDPIAEAIAELLYAKLGDGRDTDNLLIEILKCVDEARRVAYTDGQHDEALAAEFRRDK